MLVFVPFDPGELVDVPAGIDVEYVDAVDSWPDSAAECEFYVPSYRFAHRVVEVLPDMSALRAVQTLTAGYEHVLPYLRDAVTLCNATGVHDAATSELAVGMMIASQRRLPELVRAQGRRVWDQQMSSSLADQRVLVIGAGNIGRAIQRRLEGFECDVTMVGRSAREGVRPSSELPLLLPQAEIVVLILPLSEETTGLVDASFLAQLPDGALLVNVARGQVVVTADLLTELEAGRLRAALDVTDPEPLPKEHPLWDAPGLLLTPHVGGASSAMWPRSHALVSQQLQRIGAGEPLHHVVRGPDRLDLR